jgi:hypothetical protein
LNILFLLSSFAARYPSAYPIWTALTNAGPVALGITDASPPVLAAIRMN